jgi:hypothetical protein
LRRYAAEAARGPDALRPGVLDYYGRAIGSAGADDELCWGLGDYLAAKLKALAQNHSELITAYHAGVAARREAIRETSLSPEATAEAVADVAAAVAAAVETETFAGLRASRHFGGLMKDMAASMQAKLAEIDMRAEGDLRDSLVRSLELEKRQSLALVGKFTLRLASWAARRARPVAHDAAAGAGLLSLIEAIVPGSVYPYIKAALSYLGLI